MFSGATYQAEFDLERLTRQLDRVAHALGAGHWFTLRELASRTGGSEAGVSARLRDLRKQEHGGFDIERERGVGPSGLWAYRVAPADLPRFQERWP